MSSPSIKEPQEFAPGSPANDDVVTSEREPVDEANSSATISQDKVDGSISGIFSVEKNEPVSESAKDLSDEKLKEEAVASSTGEYTAPDGTVYEWDAMRRGWFPKITEDFLAMYQMSYGVDPAPTQSDSSEMKAPPVPQPSLPQTTMSDVIDGAPDSSNRPAKKRKPKVSKIKSDASKVADTEKPAATWFEVDEEKQTSIYVENLPVHSKDPKVDALTMDDICDLAKKCGLIAHDPITRKPKVKLYRDQPLEEGGFRPLKGDALITYIKRESVDLALQILDGFNYEGNILKVQLAKFQMQGEKFDDTRKRKLTNKEKRANKKHTERLFAWKCTDTVNSRPKHERVVVILGAFDPAIFVDQPEELLEIRQDLQDEACKHGECKKVTVFDRNLEGAAQIFMGSPEEADRCIASFNGRWFGGKQLKAFNWDGKTKYLVEETEEERQARLNDWNKFLEGDDDDSDEEETKDATPPASALGGEATPPSTSVPVDSP